MSPGGHSPPVRSHSRPLERDTRATVRRFMIATVPPASAMVNSPAVDRDSLQRAGYGDADTAAAASFCRRSRCDVGAVIYGASDGQDV